MAGLIFADGSKVNIQYEFLSGIERGRTHQERQESRHCFSYGSWFHPDRSGFGLLRILSEHVLAPGSDAGIRPVDNMEIITIPLRGSMSYCDSMGNREILRPGDIQLLSSGMGIFHNQNNPDPHIPLHFLQIGLLPFRRNLPPVYDRICLESSRFREKFVTIACPEKKKNCLQIRQQAWLMAGYFSSGKLSIPAPKEKENGTFLFMIQGKSRIFDRLICTGDAVGIREGLNIESEFLEPSVLLLVHIPMKHRNY
jgi:redox-sensitive bicupin YhaK (pirin superfamily)